MFALPQELWISLLLTFRLAAWVTLLLVFAGIFLAAWLTAARSRLVILAETVINLPIVLPPTVIGFYLLALFSPQQPIGRFYLHLTGETLAFHFTGLVVGSIFYSLPYAVQPITAAFRAVPQSFVDAAVSLGATRWRAFLRIILPMSWRGVLGGAILAFAHTLGEFGVVVMLGGSIPGKTRVASIALFDEVQKLDYSAAHRFSAVLLSVAFLFLLLLGWIQRRASVCVQP